jgi:hypothetical protein
MGMFSEINDSITAKTLLKILNKGRRESLQIQIFLAKTVYPAYLEYEDEKDKATFYKKLLKAIEEVE